MTIHSAAASDAPDDSAILFPDIELEAGGEKITVRELRFGEQLKHHALLVRLGEALKPTLSVAEDDALTIIMDALSREMETVMQLVAICTGKSPSFIESLSGSDGEGLLMAWWAANHAFFIRRLLRGSQTAAAVQNLLEADGEPSLPPLSGTVTDGVS
jgi:hypothetical protein